MRLPDPSPDPSSTPESDSAPLPESLPGDPDPSVEFARALRVDHAGEYGAVRIYAGQLAVLRARTAAGAPPDAAYEAQLEEMAEHEAGHLEEFNRLLPGYRVRPSALMPLWHAAGFALGAATALMGKRAAMACTVAVETEIIRHYQQQIDRMEQSHPDLVRKLERFRDEEAEHRDVASPDGSGLDTRVLRGLIGAGSRLAIRIAERI